jgi:hypothetical protein
MYHQEKVGGSWHTRADAIYGMSRIYIEYEQKIIRRCVPTPEGIKIIKKCHATPYGGHYGVFCTQAKI